MKMAISLSGNKAKMNSSVDKGVFLAVINGMTIFQTVYPESVTSWYEEGAKLNDRPNGC